MLTHKSLFGSVLLAAITLTPGCRVKIGKPETVESVSYTKTEEDAAVKSVRSFLKDIDNSREESWEDLAQIMRASVGKTAWKATLAGLEVAFGKNVGRGNAQIACTNKIPGAPSGRYFIFDIESKFERANVTERVVVAREGEGWKVAGYFRTKTITFGNEKKTP